MSDMTCKNRLGGFMLLLLLPIIWACSPESGDSPSTGAGVQRIIVEFVVPSAAGAEGGALTTAISGHRRIAAKIKSRLAPEVQKTVRIYDNLPMLALEADAETIVKLLGMKDVSSIRQDRDVLMPLAAPGFTAPGMPGGK
jgi:hypothetical protein